MAAYYFEMENEFLCTIFSIFDIYKRIRKILYYSFQDSSTGIEKKSLTGGSGEGTGDYQSASVN